MKKENVIKTLNNLFSYQTTIPNNINNIVLTDL